MGAAIGSNASCWRRAGRPIYPACCPSIQHTLMATIPARASDCYPKQPGQQGCSARSFKACSISREALGAPSVTYLFFPTHGPTYVSGDMQKWSLFSNHPSGHALAKSGTCAPAPKQFKDAIPLIATHVADKPMQGNIASHLAASVLFSRGDMPPVRARERPSAQNEQPPCKHNRS